jgi:GT2 family glycosyltransferase
MKTAVVILNWNGKGYLEKFLPGLLDSVGQDPNGYCEDYDTQIVVADNGSTDGSLEFMHERFRGVRTLQLGKNFGFTGGYNRAFEMLDCEYFVLINSDVEVTPDWIYPLQEWMEYHPECAVCSPKILSYDERVRFEYAGAAGGYLDCYGFPFCRGRVMELHETDSGQYDEPAEVLWASGACMMVRSSVYRELFGLDERFFAHMEEIDFCWRARLAGYRVHIVPRAKVYHVGGGTLPNNSPRKLFYNYRNNLLMLDKNLDKSLILANFFEIAATLEPVEEYCSDPFKGAISVYQSEEEDMKKLWYRQLVKLGMRSAKKRIRRRMILDWVSAVVYLLRGEFSYFKAVMDAHKEFKAMRQKKDFSLLHGWASDCLSDPNLKVAKSVLMFDNKNHNEGGVYFKIRGIYSRFIVWRKILKKEEIFDEIREQVD